MLNQQGLCLFRKGCIIYMILEKAVRFVMLVLNCAKATCLQFIFCFLNHRVQIHPFSVNKSIYGPFDSIAPTEMSHISSALETIKFFTALKVYQILALSDGILFSIITPIINLSI